MPLADATRSVALLGPTNTGKTHKAVERMLEHQSGMVGLPLRLLAREIYDRVSARLGQERVALITGEEKRVPRRPDYWICTTEAMPLTHEVEFLAVDEVQLATHDERGHVFTDRLLHARGVRETWFLGAGTMRPLMERLVPAARQEQHPRLSSLSFAGSSKLSKLKPRSAVVAFSVAELYEIAERLKSLRGGAAVVLGALSPRARNAQVAMFQAGEVDYLVATDAIGMGLNLDVDHVAFASLRKFDGRAARQLDDAELAQIAGRAGRYLRDGSFGTVAPLELERASAQRIEQHRFEPVRRVRWRNSVLDFASAAALVESLRAPPPAAYLCSVPDAEDERALLALLGDDAIAERAATPDALRLLWDVCQIPDFRSILFEVHVSLLRQIFLALSQGPLGNDFIAAHFVELDRTDGDRHTLVARIARLRTWAFVANQWSWLCEQEHWQERLRELEDRLSDALHRALCDSFVARRGTARAVPAAGAARKLPAPAGVELDRSHPFAALSALRGKLAPAPSASPDDDEALEGLIDAPHEAFSVDGRGNVSAGELRLGKLTRGSSLLLPEFKLLGLERAGAGLRARLQRRLLAFGRDVAARLLEPLRELSATDSGGLRAIAYQLEQQLGTAPLRDLEPLLASLDDAARQRLDASGVVIGRIAVYLPALLAPRALADRAVLLAIFDPGARLPEPLGRASYPARGMSEAAWRALGYVLLGPRAARVDLLERAAEELSAAAAPARALRFLAVPRPELLRVARSLSDRLPAPTAAGQQ
ncbi:MAG TPA: helicase-related protein [Polyangiaceae bacterium]|nr:helicase-related protein [Polyangiaceae bacterium]